MKKAFILFICISVFCLNLSSQDQERKRFYMSVTAENAFKLTNWFDDKIYNDHMYSPSTFALSFRLDWRIHGNWGAWASYGFSALGRMKGIPQDLNLFDNIDLDNFYTKDLDIVDKYSMDGGFGAKAMVGPFYKHEGKEWIFTGSMGLGIGNTGSPRMSYTLKEKDTNTAYDVKYNWFGQKKRGEYKVMGILYAEVKAERKISRKISLSLGVSYTQYLARPEFTAALYDHYDQSLIKGISQKGNYANALGIVVGVGFW